MKKVLFVLFALLSIGANAQLYVDGDINKDGKVSISDTNYLVEMLLGKKEVQTTESLIAGTWRSNDGDEITLNSDGTTEYAGASTFKYKNTEKLLYFYASDQSVSKLFNVVDIDTYFMKLKSAGESTSKIYFNHKLFVNSIIIENTYLDLHIGEQGQANLRLEPETALCQHLTWTSSDRKVATVDANGVVTGVGEGTAEITFSSLGASGVLHVTVSGHAYVDLGLSVKWATCNLGATLPEDYGDYFAWGEVNSKNCYTWPSYTYCDGSYKSLNKYCNTSTYGTVDALTKLQSTDDAAKKIYGEDWHIPTLVEFEELTEKCSCQWIENYNASGVSGYMFTSKVSGYEGKSIFLPAAGYSHEYETSSIDQEGHYWTSSLADDVCTRAKMLTMNSSSISFESGQRQCGRSIRPVTNSSTIVDTPTLVSSITLSKSTLTLKAGESSTITATISPENATNKSVTWTSSDETVATISGGVIKAIKAGTATISAKANDGSEVSASCGVTVNDDVKTYPNQTLTKAGTSTLSITAVKGQVLSFDYSVKLNSAWYENDMVEDNWPYLVTDKLLITIKPSGATSSTTLVEKTCPSGNLYQSNSVTCSETKSYKFTSSGTFVLTIKLTRNVGSGGATISNIKVQ